VTILAVGYLTFLGANAGSPTSIEIQAPASVRAEGKDAVATFEAGKQVTAQSGCLACHKIEENGNDGPGPPLTEIGGRLPRQAIARTLINPTAPMPSFRDLPKEQFDDLVAFLSMLKGESEAG
jgi:menaquinol-cytochrome c reductase cytochrome b/c subunit